MFKIYVNIREDFELISEDKIEKTVDSIFEAAELEKFGEISISLVDDEEMSELNLQYRGIEGTTDVLSFSQDEGMEMARPEDPKYIPLIGDIVISVPTAQHQAEEAGHGFEEELKVLLIHGILHLFGYDHDNIYQQAFMRDEEKSILAALEKIEQVSSLS